MSLTLSIPGLRIIRRLGHGGAGEVFLAREEASGRLVAVKALWPELVQNDESFERFALEAILASRLHHPNIVRVHELGEAAGRYYLVMEYVNGPSLRARLDGGPLPLARAARIAAAIAAAIREAHRQGIVHCDVKPGNILLARGDVPKLADLGVALTRGPAHGDSALPVSAPATPAYVAPERCVPGAPVDGRADIYSLGATFYHMICGRPPFVGAGWPCYARQHLESPPPDPREFNAALPPGACDVALRMLAKKPQDRYQTCEQVEAALAALAVGHEEDAAPPGPQTARDVMDATVPLSLPQPNQAPPSSSAVSEPCTETTRPKPA
ncbi:MAG TPA: serine/threonine-protein kinase [Candidatus Brocadiia bacterium]|nr:serine/threonine-protein kinase [Candidatus Brocadiia bacterium]